MSRRPASDFRDARKQLRDAGDTFRTAKKASEAASQALRSAVFAGHDIFAPSYMARLTGVSRQTIFRILRELERETE